MPRHTTHSHYPGLLTMESNLGCSSCSHYCLKCGSNSSSRLHVLNNNVQKNKRTMYNKYSICYSVSIRAMLKLSRLKAAKQRTRQKKLYNGIVLVFLLVGASWQGIVNPPIEQTSWSLRTKVHTLLNKILAVHFESSHMYLGE